MPAPAEKVEMALLTLAQNPQLESWLNPTEVLSMAQQDNLGKQSGGKGESHAWILFARLMILWRTCFRKYWNCGAAAQFHWFGAKPCICAFVHLLNLFFPFNWPTLLRIPLCKPWGRRLVSFFFFDSTTRWGEAIFFFLTLFLSVFFSFLFDDFILTHRHNFYCGALFAFPDLCFFYFTCPWSFLFYPPTCTFSFFCTRSACLTVTLLQPHLFFLFLTLFFSVLSYLY